MTDFHLPDGRVLHRARMGLKTLRQVLAAAGRASWHTYAIRGVEIHPDTWALYLITPATSLPLSRELGAALSLDPIWLAGRLKVWALPLDFHAAGHPSEPLYAMEVSAVVLPRFSGGGPGAKEAASYLASVIDAREGHGVRLAFAVPRPPWGWPP